MTQVAMTDVTLFLREFARTRRDTGAVAPSSPLLARALTRHVIPSPGRARAVLEVGPGTGAVTRRIRASLGALDTLDLVEANPRFAELLHRDHGGDERVRLLTGLVQEHHLGSYDTIVCGLPFANFDAGTVEDIFGRLLSAATSRRHAVVLRVRGDAAAAPGVHDGRGARADPRGAGRHRGDHGPAPVPRRDGARESAARPVPHLAPVAPLLAYAG
ncbi:hypothetical protein ABZS88_29960 [Streptomyces sp. NPDC005480]|uniref:class I SAM-dependent methyltransferase n=1 Tax=Streptomyces sp. NPDC005480 TaxID=3154880 RepID=UPI0033AED6C9